MANENQNTEMTAEEAQRILDSTVMPGEEAAKESRDNSSDSNDDNPQNTDNSDNQSGDNADASASGGNADNDDDDDDPQGDERPSEKNMTDEERQKRNREWRAQRKERRREQEEARRNEIAALHRTIAEQNARLAVIERKSTGMEEATIDEHLKNTADAYNFYKTEIATRGAAGDHAGVAEAVEKMGIAQARYSQLTNVKKAYQQRQAQPQPLDPRMTSLATKWMSDHKWYDPTGKDPDSIRVLTEDNILVREGYRPETPEYWEELSKRVARILPHRAKKGHNSENGAKNTRRSSVSSGAETSSSDGGRPKGSFQLSAERVQAIKEAGKWDDPVQRASMIKRYQQYDREQAANQRN